MFSLPSSRIKQWGLGNPLMSELEESRITVLVLPVSLMVVVKRGKVYNARMLGK